MLDAVDPHHNEACRRVISPNRVVLPRTSYTISDAGTPSATLDAPGTAPATVDDVNRSAQS